jgi:hypothetical protein
VVGAAAQLGLTGEHEIMIRVPISGRELLDLLLRPAEIR